MRTIIDRRHKRNARIQVVWQSEAQPVSFVRRGQTYFFFAGRLYLCVYGRVKGRD
jgi:hypothetical protein